MKYLVILLILLTFLQTTVLPVNIVLLVVLCRSFLVDDKQNFYLAFGFGVLISLLTNQPIGVLSLIFLSLVGLVYILKSSPILTTFISVFVSVTFLMALFKLLDYLIYKQPFSWMNFLAVVILIPPVYILLQLWEERFIVKTGIKLKLGK